MPISEAQAPGQWEWGGPKGSLCRGPPGPHLFHGPHNTYALTAARPKPGKWKEETQTLCRELVSLTVSQADDPMTPGSCWVFWSAKGLGGAQ